jgi:hypothetical protein
LQDKLDDDDGDAGWAEESEARIGGGIPLSGAWCHAF